MTNKLRAIGAGIMSGITDFGSQLCQKTSEITEFLRLESTTEKLRIVSKTLDENHEVWAKRERIFQGVERTNIDVVFNPDSPVEHDKELIDRAVNDLSMRYPSGIGKELVGQSDTERYESFVKEFKNAAKTLGVEVNDFIVFFPKTEDDYYLRGQFNRKNKNIYINGYWMYNEKPEMVETVFFTMYHELMHKRQLDAFNVKKDYGYSEDLLIKWGWSFENYIPPEVDDFLYRTQPVESYAFSFVDEVRQRYNQNIK